MFIRTITALFRISGSSTRCMANYRIGTLSSQIKLPPSVLMTLYQPTFTSPSVIKNNNKRSILDIPISINSIIQDVPKIIVPFEDQTNVDIIEDPTKVIEQKAARLIVIRRKKMKKHKLKKLRKKMKFIWAKVRQKREMRKEKAFQAELMGQISEAEKFNAALFAKEKLDKANVVLLPKLWRGKRLPEFVIKELIEKRDLKRKLKAEGIERRKNMNLTVSDYKL